MEARTERARRLSLPDVVAQSVGFMGPVFSVSILLPLLVGANASGKGAGGAAPLAVLLAGIGMLALSWTVAQFARRIRHTGSLYVYVADGLGHRVGAAAGFLYYAGIIALGGGIGILIGGYVHDTLGAEFGHPILPVVAWQLLVLALLLAVLYIGVQISTRAQLVLALVSIAVLLVFFAYLVVKVGSANSGKAFSPTTSSDGWGGVLFAVVYGVLLFTGFETSANLAEETEHPHRDIPRAMLFSVLLATGFFLFGAYAQVAGYHFSVSAMLKNQGAPLVTLGTAHEFGSVWTARLLELVILLDMLAVYIGCSVSATRGVFALARDRRLPRALAITSRRTGTPLGATVLIGGLYLIGVAIPTWWPHVAAVPGTPSYAAFFNWLSAYGAFALAVIYLLVSVAAVRALRDHPRIALVYTAATIGVVITGAAIFGAMYKVPHPTIFATYAALGTLAVAAVAVAVVGGRPAVTEPVPDSAVEAGT